MDQDNLISENSNNHGSESGSEEESQLDDYRAQEIWFLLDSISVCCYFDGEFQEPAKNESEGWCPGGWLYCWF